MFTKVSHSVWMLLFYIMPSQDKAKCVNVMMWSILFASKPILFLNVFHSSICKCLEGYARMLFFPACVETIEAGWKFI